MEKELEFVDRYAGNYPDPKTICKGDCEGMGLVPIKKDDPGYEQKWQEAESKNPSDDGYHFVTCNDCNGTGKS